MSEQILAPKSTSATSQQGSCDADDSYRSERQIKPSRYVDMWGMPGLHPTNVDIIRKLRTAEDRQFGANMAICGTLSDRDLDTNQWEKTHLIGIRTDAWKPSEKDRRRALNSVKKARRQQIRREIKRTGQLNKGEKLYLDSELDNDGTMNLEAGDVDKNRLVLKLFRTTGKNIRWVGSIEELTSRAVHHSLGSKKRLLSFAVNLHGYDYVTIINQNHRTFRVPAVFTFSYYDDEQKHMWYVEIKRRWVSVGADFIVEAQGKRIGYIDGKLFRVGSDSHIRIDEPTLANDHRFMDLLALFSSPVGYHGVMRKHVKRRLKALNDGTPCHMIDTEEFNLLRNPRRKSY